VLRDVIGAHDQRGDRRRARCAPHASRFTVTIGRCLRPRWKLTSNVSFAPGLPRANVQGAAHGEPRGQNFRGSNRGRRLAGNSPRYTSFGVLPPSQVCAETVVPINGWGYHHHARYAAESGGLSPAKNPEARLRFSHSTNPGDLFAGDGRGAGSGDRKIQREANWRKQSVSRVSRHFGQRRDHPRRPWSQRLVRHCLAASAQYRCRSPQAPTSPDGFPDRRTPSQERSSGLLGAAAMPTWRSADQYATLPNELTLRKVRVCVLQTRFRTRAPVRQNVAITNREEVEAVRKNACSASSQQRVANKIRSDGEKQH